MTYLAAELASLQNAVKKAKKGETVSPRRRGSPSALGKTVGNIENYPDLMKEIVRRNSGGWMVQDLVEFEPIDKSPEALARWIGWGKDNPYMVNFGKNACIIDSLVPTNQAVNKTGWRVEVEVDGQTYKIAASRLKAIMASGHPSWKSFLNIARSNYGNWMSYPFQQLLAEFFEVPVDSVRPVFKQYTQRATRPVLTNSTRTVSVDIGIFDPVTGTESTKLIEGVLALLEKEHVTIPPLFAFPERLIG